ncbi:MAG: formimidoylglutamate deiminase [Acidobacteriota bacterium]
MRHYFCEHLFTGLEWLESVHLTVNAEGDIASLRAVGAGDRAAAAAERLPGPVVPGLPNLHSHAHQRAMAGLAERASAGGRDSFWSWREVMYRHLAALTPDDLEAIAAQAYVEMLESGFTAVGEFQYLHHQADGSPYEQPAEMTLRCLAAARSVGLGMTALPVFYAQGGFAGQPPGEGQKRFVCDLDLFAEIIEAVRAALEAAPRDGALGLAPHSLRAVGPEDLRALEGLAPGLPIHLHIAEQVREVEDCLAWCGRRPVEWLLENHEVSARWCLVHATHLGDGELEGLARSGAVAGLCPVTEANLGDGIFRAAEYLRRGGSLGLGTDSHIAIDPVHEMRLLEYGQRLRELGRNALAGAPRASTGESLLRAALEGGARACGRRIGRLAAGSRADWLVLDGDAPFFAARAASELIDSWIFASSRPAVREVYVAGRRVVEAGRHVRRDSVAARFRSTLEHLRSRA